MTVMAPVNPFTDATCRQPGTLARWWDDDARRDERAVAARLCRTCPVIELCRALADDIGPAASGTWAGVYRPHTGGHSGADGEALAEYLALFGPTTHAPDPASPTRHGRHWIHPAQLQLEWQDT